MPIPFLLAGLGIVAVAAGAGGHLTAKETNQKAEAIRAEAQEIYDRAKLSLENEKKKTQDSLIKLGTHKSNVLNTSVKRFLNAYDRVKHIEMRESVGLNEIANFALDSNDALELRQLSDIYQSSGGSMAAGAAASAAIALAASGSLPVIGSALLAGNVGAAATLAGSALSATPLAVLAAPVVLFTAISANVKADENLHKAQTMLSEAEAAAEKMETSKTMCAAITERSNMYDKLLADLERYFVPCSAKLDKMTRKKMGLFKNREVTRESLTEEDIKLIAVSRSLAGAVKAVLDTPLLDKNGELTDESEDVYSNTTEALPALTEQARLVVNEIPVTNSSASLKNKESYKTSTAGAIAAKNILAVILGIIATAIASGAQNDFLLSIMIGTCVCMTFIANKEESGFFVGAVTVFGIEFLVLFSANIGRLVEVETVAENCIWIIVCGFVASLIMLAASMRFHFLSSVFAAAGYITISAAAVMLVWLLHGALCFFFWIAMIITIPLYIIALFIVGFMVVFTVKET